MNRSMRNEVNALASKLFLDADARNEAGDIDSGLLSTADALLMIKDQDPVHHGAGQIKTYNTNLKISSQ